MVEDAAVPLAGMQSPAEAPPATARIGDGLRAAERRRVHRDGVGWIRRLFDDGLPDAGKSVDTRVADSCWVARAPARSPNGAI